MKLADSAKPLGVRYETAWRWFRDGKIQSQRIGPHTIILTEGQAAPEAKPQRVAIYARVSSAENQPNLDSQVDQLSADCAAKGYQVAKVVKEIGSGVHAARPKLLALLDEQVSGFMVVEPPDRATRFGFCQRDPLLKSQGRAREVVTRTEHGQEDLLADLIAILYRFTTQLYGQRRAKHKTHTIIRALEAGESEGADAPG